MALLRDEKVLNFEQDMSKFLLEKSKEVQIDTSKKVLKQFYRYYETSDQHCQTSFNDGETIKLLERKIRDLQIYLDEA